MPPRGRRATKFVADAMLGSLARKLRAFGFDTPYFKEGDDAALISLAREEKRVLLTSDGSLSRRARSRHVPALLITGSKESQRISSLRAAAKVAGIRIESGTRRCSVCNGRLRALRRADVSGSVPASVERRHRLFFQCVECGHRYWRGTHWKKLRWLERRLGANPRGTVT